MAVAIVLAAGAAFLSALAVVLQRVALESAPVGSSFSPRLMTHALRKRGWLIGFGLMLCMFVLQASALRFGQLSVVQPVLTGELIFLVIIEIAAHLDGCPAADDTVLITSELATNAVLHSASTGEFFTVRCEAHPGYVRVEVEDLGGPWHCHQPDGRPHGLDIIEALTGPDNWGTETTSDGNRIVWARLDLPRQGPAT